MIAVPSVRSYLALMHAACHATVKRPIIAILPDGQFFFDFFFPLVLSTLDLGVQRSTIISESPPER